MEKSNLVFSAVIVKEGEGFSALCIDLDVASDGQTVDEARNNLFEAVTLYIESALESNLTIIRPVPPDENPMNTKWDEVVEVFNIKIDLQIHAYA